MHRKIAVLILMLMFASIAYAQEETIDIGDTVEDQLEDEAMDFVFEAEEGDFLYISLESNDFDTVVSVLNEDGEEVKRDDDSGEDNNSLLTFMVPASGSYTIRVASFSSDASGDFVLRLRAQEVTELTFGESVDIEFDSAETHYFSFTGTEGQAVSIGVDSGGELDTFLVLKKDEIEITRDDDGGEGVDPLIRDTILPSDGVYMLELAPLSGNELEGEATLLIEEVEIPSLDDNVTQTATFEPEDALGVFQFTAEEGEDYLVSVETDEETDLNIEIYIDNTYITYANVSPTHFASFAFTAPDSGIGIVRVTSSFYDEEDIEVNVSLTRHE